VSVGTDHFHKLDDWALVEAGPGSSPEEAELAAALAEARSLRDASSLNECIMRARRAGLDRSSSPLLAQAVELSREIAELLEDSRRTLGMRLRSSKGNAVVFGHKNWDLVMNVMQGLQLAVSRTSAEGNRPVSAFDFGSKEKCVRACVLRGARSAVRARTRAHASVPRSWWWAHSLRVRVLPMWLVRGSGAAARKWASGNCRRRRRRSR
jgi:hypothetical protein